MNADARPSITAPVLIVVWLLFTIGIYIPGTLYLDNAPDFSLTLTDFLLVAVPTFSICVVMGIFVLRVVPGLGRPRFVVILFTVTALVWLQGNLLVWQYGPLDGRPIKWEEHWTNGVIDTLIWVAALTLATIRPLPIYRAAKTIATLILTMSVLLFGFQALQGNETKEEGSIKDFRIDDSGKFTLSEDRNIILIVLDETQSDIFSRLIVDQPSYANVFEGFTYFPDALAASNFTEVAIPAIVTGTLYDNSVPKIEYMRESFLNQSIFALLSRNGYWVEMFPWVGWGNESMYFDQALASNLKSVQGGNSGDSKFLTEKKAKELIQLLDLTLFRCVPHFVKPVIHNDQKWRLVRIATKLIPSGVKQSVSTDNEFETTSFARDFTRNFRSTASSPAFKNYHLKGVHLPLTVLPDLTIGEKAVEVSYTNYRLQLEASIVGLQNVFTAMKNADIFDQSMIIVVGDHGSGRTSELYISSRTEDDPEPDIDESIRQRDFNRDKARGVPLLLVKKFDAQGLLEVSSTPVSVLDIGATIASELGVEGYWDRLSVFDPSDRAQTPRYYGAFDFTAIKSTYVGAISLYKVVGHSWDDSSWKLEKILEPALSDQ